MKKIIILTAGLLFSGLFATFATAQGSGAGNIEIAHPNARAMVPGAKVGGGYLTITNHGAADDRLVGVTSDRAVSAEVHLMSVDGGVMTMRAVSGGLVVPAGKTVELKPGGYHIMFMDVAQPFRAGETIKATLTFEKAGAMEVDFSVGNAGGSAGRKGHSDTGHSGEGHSGEGHSGEGHSDMSGMDMDGVHMPSPR
jgi:copper(I)-binding protein